MLVSPVHTGLLWLSDFNFKEDTDFMMTLTLLFRKFSQYEMVVTQWGFVGPALLWPDKLGISVTSPETEEVRSKRMITFFS